MKSILASASVSAIEAVNAPYVLVQEREPGENSRGWYFVKVSAQWILWLTQASIVKNVGPGKPSLQRHEFESVEMKRGGFGNVL